MRRTCIFAIISAVALTLITPADAASGPKTTRLSTLVQIRAAHHPGFDRVVFRFEGRVPPSRVRYVNRLIGDPSGLAVPVPGRALLQVTMRDARAHDAGGTTVSHRNTFRLPNAMSIIRSGDFEGVVTYGIGLSARQPFNRFTLTNPSRIVVDVETGFRTEPRRVFLIDDFRVEDGTPPYVRAVSRRVRPQTPATGVMDRLFAGPTPFEAESGLRPPTFPSPTARSGATGFDDLTIRNRIARVRLTGGCDSGGSTVTIANEIFPTLRQFDNVDFVKIYSPAGNTAQPFGPSDSIPACLEP